jgi:hypothetical protein
MTVAPSLHCCNRSALILLMQQLLASHDCCSQLALLQPFRSRPIDAATALSVLCFVLSLLFVLRSG